MISLNKFKWISVTGDRLKEAVIFGFIQQGNFHLQGIKMCLTIDFTDWVKK